MTSGQDLVSLTCLCTREVVVVEGPTLGRCTEHHRLGSPPAAGTCTPGRRARKPHSLSRDFCPSVAIPTPPNRYKMLTRCQILCQGLMRIISFNPQNNSTGIGITINLISQMRKLTICEAGLKVMVVTHSGSWNQIQVFCDSTAF